MLSDEELRTTYRVSVEADGTLLLKFFRPVSEEVDVNRVTDLVLGEGMAAFAQHPGKQFRVLLDISAFATTATMTPHSMKRYGEIARHPQMLKCAVVGSSDLQSGPINFILHLTKDFRRVSWFANESEARLWLNS